MLKVKGFGYDDEKDMDVMKHIKKQPHEGNYIIGLVRKDMNKESLSTIIRKEIEKYLKGIEIKREEPTNIDAEEIMNILSL